MNALQSSQKTNDFGAALVLMILAPMMAEVLPGATRFSSIFVLPIEIIVWGGGALLIRYAVRRWRLGWSSLVLMGLALAVTEECIIQQTSLAPLVVRLKGVTYARAFGVNYVYLLWALIYETVFVVILPISLAELIFPSRRERPWISKGGFFAVIPLFVLGSLLAWYTWTQIARVKVFHLPAFTPPAAAILLSFALMAILVFIALRGRGKTGAAAAVSAPSTATVTSWTPPSSGILISLGVIWATLLYGLVLLGFGIDPGFPPFAAIAGGLLLALLPLIFVPRWNVHAAWSRKKTFALVFGTALGAMLVGFLGFWGTGGPDLWFKTITNVLAILLLIRLGVHVKHKN